MKRIWSSVLGVMLIAGMMLAAKSSVAVEESGTGMSESKLIQQETDLENTQRDYLQKNVLDKILGPEKAIVIVDIMLGLETKITKQAASERKNERKKKLGEVDYLLPGVPNPKSVSQEQQPGESKEESGQAQESKVDIKVVTKQILVTVIHDKKIPKPKLVIVKDAIAATLRIDEKRGDKIEFKESEFTMGFWEKMMEPKILIPAVLAMLLLFFLFGPLSSFFRSYVATLREKGGTEVTVDSKFQGGPDEEGEGKDGKGGGGGGGAGELEEKEIEEKYEPFNYVNEENLKRLIICLIRMGSAQTIALVVSYLKPEFVREILNALPPDMQARVAIEMATIHQMNQEQVMAVDMDLKEKIDFLIGGLDHLLKVLDQVDTSTRDNILSFLKEQQPELYDKVRKFIILFEDIATFPDQAMQLIIRELKSDSLAKALRNAQPEIMNKFFSNMSSNAAVVLKEEMEYGRPLTPEEIEDEREKIIGLIKQLENDGKIFIREKPKGMMLDGVEGSAAEAPAGNFEEYYNAAVQYYEAGQYDEAVAYFEYCSQLDPNSAAVLQYLGGTYLALGRSDEAVNSYQRALQLDPTNEDLKNWLAQQVKA